jgi:hypothetical protein
VVDENENVVLKQQNKRKYLQLRFQPIFFLSVIFSIFNDLWISKVKTTKTTSNTTTNKQTCNATFSSTSLDGVVVDAPVVVAKF